MCLATVYKNTQDTEEVVLKNVSKDLRGRKSGAPGRYYGRRGSGRRNDFLCRPDRFRRKVKLPVRVRGAAVRMAGGRSK